MSRLAKCIWIPLLFHHFWACRYVNRLRTLGPPNTPTLWQERSVVLLFTACLLKDEAAKTPQLFNTKPGVSHLNNLPLMPSSICSPLCSSCFRWHSCGRWSNWLDICLLPQSREGKQRHCRNPGHGPPEPRLMGWEKRCLDIKSRGFGFLYVLCGIFSLSFLSPLLPVLYLHIKPTGC